MQSAVGLSLARNSPEVDRSRRVFVMGASGVIGSAVLRCLLRAGHRVTGASSSHRGVQTILDLGAEAVEVNALDEEGLHRAVAGAEPEVLVNLLTRLPRSGLNPRKLATYYEENNRVRTYGARHLLAAAKAVGVSRFINEGVAFWYDQSSPGLKSEDDPLWTEAPEPIGQAARTVASVEAEIAASGLDGVVLRFGSFYGPGTWYSADGEIARQMRKRMYPIIGSGSGVTSFVQVQDAASACCLFVSQGPAGIYNVVDDEPAAARDWMPTFAKAVGAPKPPRAPKLVARMVAGGAMVEWAGSNQAASNEALKSQTPWRPRFPSWRQGFFEGISPD